MFLPSELKTLPSPEACVYFAYAALKDNPHPEISLAWSSLARSITMSVDVTSALRLAESAATYSDSPTEQNLLELRNEVLSWRSKANKK
jgi:hypothetical protein